MLILYHDRLDINIIYFCIKLSIFIEVAVLLTTRKLASTKHRLMRTNIPGGMGG